MKDHLQTYKQARLVGVPIIVWNTADAAASIHSIRTIARGPAVQWDVVRGALPVNEAAQTFLSGESAIGNPVEFLEIAAGYPAAGEATQGACAIMLNAQLFLNAPGVIQGVWNLRDKFKENGRTLILMGHNVVIPSELAYDALTIDESLPTEGALAQIALEQLGAAGVEGAVEKSLEAAKTITGMSAFAAEQALAMAMVKNGKGYTLDSSELWERKRKTIEQTKGLTVWRGGETLGDIGGVAQVKGYVRMVMSGKIAPNGIVFIDEIEKAMAGSRADGDNTGASQDQLGVILETMQDTQAQGMLFIGHPGSAKSMVAKAAGATIGIPTMKMDLGAMKGARLGDSEGAIRAAMKVIGSVTNGKALYIATCNKLDSLPPELRRRFTLGTFFFDLPNDDERNAIWGIYRKKYGIKEAVTDGGRQYEGWTGADIQGCCHRAWAFDISIKEAAKYATPMIKTAPAAIEALRRMAHNAFLSASQEGLYQMPTRPTETTQGSPARKFNREED